MLALLDAVWCTGVRPRSYVESAKEVEVAAKMERKPDPFASLAACAPDEVRSSASDLLCCTMVCCRLAMQYNDWRKVLKRCFATCIQQQLSRHDRWCWC